MMIELLALFQGRIERGEAKGCGKELLSRPWRILECTFDVIPGHLTTWPELCPCDGPSHEHGYVGSPFLVMQVHHLRRSGGPPAVVAIGQCWHCKAVAFAELKETS